MPTFSDLESLSSVRTKLNDAITTAETLSNLPIVKGPASAVTDRIAVFDGTTGKLIRDGGYTVADISVPTTSEVLTAMAGIVAGDVGTTALLRNNSVNVASLGTTRSGGDLSYSSGDGSYVSVDPVPGIWMCLGAANGSAAATGERTTLWVRID